MFSFKNTENEDTGLSVFHKLALTVLKSKNKPKEMSYRDYENFKSNIFHDKLNHAF